MLRTIANKFINIMNFDGEVRHLVHILNKRIEMKAEIPPLKSHPNGFKREITSRRIRIATAYINIVRQLESEKYEDRLDALENLIQESFYAKKLDMPLNTARLQAALMKEVVKYRGNLRKQMEYMTDFTRASYGHPAVIRELLKKMSLIEVPDEGKQLLEMNLGWDGHVHDNLSEGRKTLSQVLLDAFIKGISEVTLVYYNFIDTRIMLEAIRAGEILGIKVSTGIEFSVGKSGQREHFMFLLPSFNDVKEYINFLSVNKEKLQLFREGLKKNTFYRQTTLKNMLEQFNKNHLQELNVENFNLNALTVNPLSWEDLKEIVLEGQASRKHLGELLYRKLKPVLYRKVIALKAQYETVRQEVKERRKSRTDLQVLQSLYKTTRSTYEELTPEKLRLKYFENKSAFDYDSVFLSGEEILPELRALSCETVYIHPLEAGITKAITTIIKHHKYITQVETFNMQDSIYRNPVEYHIFNDFISLINRGSFEDLTDFCERSHITGISEEELSDACTYYHSYPLRTRCGSDSTGRDPRIPGMGFIRLDSIAEKSSRNFFYRTHKELPFNVDICPGNKFDAGEDANNYYNKGAIISLGKISEFKKNYVGDEENLTEVNMNEFWTYLNPTLKNVMKISAGAIPATLTIGHIYTFIWFGITFLRNVIADLTSNSGFNPREWRFEDIDYENSANSLFWTGFSVPYLKCVSFIFDNKLISLFNIMNSTAIRWGKFFILSFTNGIYLYSHNSLRGFSERVKKMNFFRSIFSFPFASISSYLMDYFHKDFIPDVVQANIWSNVVAGVIEGTGKYQSIKVSRKRDFMELLPMLDSFDEKKRVVAIMDIIYIWAKSQRGKTTLYDILIHDKELIKKMYKIYQNNVTMEEVIEMVLSNYHHDEEALALTGIIGSYYSHFCTWLNKIYRTSIECHSQ